MKAKLGTKKTRTCCISVWECPGCSMLIPAFDGETQIVEDAIKGYVSVAWLLERGYQVFDDEGTRE